MWIQLVGGHTCPPGCHRGQLAPKGIAEGARLVPKGLSLPTPKSPQKGPKCPQKGPEHLVKGVGDTRGPAATPVPIKI